MLGPQQKFDFKERPFEAVQGEHFDFSRPWYDMRIQLAGVHQLLASPEDWVARLISRLQWLDPMTTGYDDRPQPVRELPILRSSKCTPPGSYTGLKSVVLCHRERLFC